MGRRLALILAGVALAVIGLGSAVLAANQKKPGAYDPKFGDVGARYGLLPDFPFPSGLDNYGGLALSPGGKIILAGDTEIAGVHDFAIGRLRTNGHFDTSFGNAITHVSEGNISGDDEVHGIASGPGGSIFVASGSELAGVERIGVAKLDADGFLDNGFDGDGRTTTLVGTDAFARAIAVQKNGKVVVVGAAEIGGDNQLVLVRYLATGPPDPAFGGGDGIVTTKVGKSAVAIDVEIQKNGKIVVTGGDSFGAAPSSEGIVVRYRANGTLDPGFGSGGIARFRSAKQAVFYGLAIGSDGKVVAVGVTDQKLSGVVLRLTAAGKRDHRFGGGDGIVRSNFRQSAFVYLTGVAVQRNRKIVVAGFGGDTLGALGGSLLARLRPNGRLDKGFANRGSRLFLLGATGFSLTSVAIQPNGRIVVGGAFEVGGNTQGLFAARFLGDPVHKKK